jgi:hypothetical protein
LRGQKLKDQKMKKIRSLALAGLFALVAVHCDAGTITESFFTDPLQNGWQTFGDANLFHWNSTNQNLDVTWNSTNQNSYFYKPLGTILTRDDDFSLSFDLQLNDAVAFNYGQELAVGLFNLTDATNVNFSRAGGNSPNLFELDYFPDTGFGDSIDATLIDTNVGFTDFYFAYDNKSLLPGITYQITLVHAAGTTNLTGQVLTNGVLYTSLPFTYAGPITDFRIDTLSISSYQDDGFGDSILAHGVVDNFVITLPPPPVQNLIGFFTNSTWQVEFTSRTNWYYNLERSTNLLSWSSVSDPVESTGTNMIFMDLNPPSNKAFYRINAERQ